MSRKRVLFLGISLTFIWLGVFRLGQIPGEWYGDISNVHEYVSQILRGEWPFYFFQSPGPVYHYVIVPIIMVIGQSYTDYKIASVIVGLIGLLAMYLLAREIDEIKVGLLTMGIASSSFWYIVWARTGNSQIIIPSEVALMVFFVIRFKNSRRWRDLLWSIFAASLGFFTYPQTFILPGLFFLLLFYTFIINRTIKNKGKIIFYSLIVFLPAVLLFGKIVTNQPDNFTSGYIGSKLFKIQEMPPGTIFSILVRNAWRTATMFYIEGDAVFRVNVSRSPELDRISGGFFLIGILYWLKSKRRKYFPYILISLVLLPIPSMSPALPPIEIPNSGRTIGMVPFVYILIASGMVFLFEYLRRIPKSIKYALFFLLIVMMVYQNLLKYFIRYPEGLPNRNVPFGKIIASYIDNLPPQTHVFLTSCCWGEWGQPEPKAIYYVLKNKKGRENIVYDPFITSCDKVKKTEETLLIFNPTDINLVNQFKGCFPDGNVSWYEFSDQSIFSSLYLKRRE